MTDPTGGSVIDVLVVDDHALMRAGLSGLIDGAADMRVVGLAADGGEALELIRTAGPQVVLMDLSMSGMDGITATGRISQEFPDTAVLVLTSFSDRQRVTDALDAGAVGYVLKDSEPASLLEAIRAVARGLSPSTRGWPGWCSTDGGPPPRPCRPSSPTASRRCSPWSAGARRTSRSPARSASGRAPSRRT
jgi:CheY-like chemotaxis protein